MTTESRCSIGPRHLQFLLSVTHTSLSLLPGSWPSSKCQEQSRHEARYLRFSSRESEGGSAGREHCSHPGTSGLRGPETEPSQAALQRPPPGRGRKTHRTRLPAPGKRKNTGSGRRQAPESADSLPRGARGADPTRDGLPLPWPPTPLRHQGRPLPGPQFPRPGQLASVRGRGPHPQGLGLTGKRGTISTEQQWQKYRPGCGDASAMATSASSAPPAPRAAPAAGRLLLPRRPTRPRTLTHGTHGTHGVRLGGGGRRGAGSCLRDGGRRGAN